MKEMSTFGAIVYWLVLLFIALEVTALIASVIYMRRRDNEECDAAADERKALVGGQRTLIDRIERLQRQIESSQERTNNYIIFNHTRNAVIEDALGYVTPQGGVKITGAPLKIEPKYFLKEVRLLVILKDGETAGGFLGG